ncbi:MAG: DUF2141 domain-containing protein [Alphaproteobacteria bacterium]|nr:DUF2141 domain-containing protein [Alphaproteobacteria bacterium]
MSFNLSFRPFFAGVAASSALILSAAAAGDAAITVTITDIETPEGFMMIAIFDEAGWEGESLEAVRLPVSGDSFTTTLALPSPGQYGLKVFHDVDGNGKLNSNMIGIPTEPFGFSNNAPPRFGPPSFADAAFAVDENGAKQTISLK